VGLAADGIAPAMMQSRGFPLETLRLIKEIDVGLGETLFSMLKIY
jgi:hypothetical protein